MTLTPMPCPKCGKPVDPSYELKLTNWSQDHMFQRIYRFCWLHMAAALDYLDPYPKDGE